MKYLIQINYKSGNSVQLWFNKFKITTNVVGNQSFEWELNDPTQKILMLGADNVESVIQLNCTN